MEKSIARNHHYISQVEQRLNAIDSSVKSENQRIYKFSVVDAESKKIEITDHTGIKIEKNLAVKDLYALRMLDGGGQQNLESAFQQYEDGIGAITRSLNSKLADPANTDLKGELLRLYLLKLLNSFRNPYSIKDTLKNLELLKGVTPGNVELATQLLKMDEGQRTQVSRICEVYQVTEAEYIEWLKAICLLILQPLDHGLNFLESLVKQLMEDDNLVKDITIFTYDVSNPDCSVLLSDRGIVLGNVEDGVRVQMFNLDSQNFISFMFIDYGVQQILPVPERAMPRMKEYAKKTRVCNPLNNMEMLEAYNRHCVWQAAAHVYCSKPTAYGIEVVNQP